MVDDDFFFIPLHFPCPCLSLLRSWLVFVIYPFAHWRSLYVYMNMRMQFECQCYRSSLFFGVIWSAIHIIWFLCIYYLLLYQWSIQFIAFNQNKFFITSNYLTFSQMVGSVFHHQHGLKKKSGFVHHIQVDTQVESIIYDDDDNKRHLVKCFFFRWTRCDCVDLVDIDICFLYFCCCLPGHHHYPCTDVDMECIYLLKKTMMSQHWWQVARWCLTHLIPCHHLAPAWRLTYPLFYFFFNFVTDDHLIFHYRNCIRNSNPDVVKDVRPWPSTKKQEQF